LVSCTRPSLTGESKEQGRRSNEKHGDSLRPGSRGQCSRSERTIQTFQPDHMTSPSLKTVRYILAASNFIFFFLALLLVSLGLGPITISTMNSIQRQSWRQHHQSKFYP
jgi:hypothetical protein